MALRFADRLLRLGAGLAVISIAVLSGLSGMHWLVASSAQGSCSQRSMTAARSGRRRRSNQNEPVCDTGGYSENPAGGIPSAWIRRAQ